MRFKADDVNLDRVLSRLGHLAEIGATAAGGVTRLTFSPEHLRATQDAAGWMSEAGLDSFVDQYGNLLASRAGSDSGAGLVLSGSHLDSVPNGGNYDGVLGVLAPLEALTLLQENNLATRRPLGLVSFIEEEGARFHGLLGSTLAVGQLSEVEIADIRDADGIPYLDALNSSDFGLPRRHVNWSGGLRAFLELHIEQGKRLEAAGIPVGVVTSIAGPTFLRVRFTGQADHAGATEWGDRRDSLLAAAQVIVALRDMAMQEFEGRAHVTVGALNVKPNVTNVIAGETVFNIDFRAADADARTGMLKRIADILAGSAASQGIKHDVEELHYAPPVKTSAHLRNALLKGAAAAGVDCMPLVSWAAHDAMNMARVTDSGMLFVPCRDGRSHTPEEYVAPEDIASGIAALANALLELAGQA
ncbi:MAG: M20 family metallo-hydrolase [Anaerolineaceae bacterium]|nr:M20 family metallo-hydrolase [Anaerolineaceae bacterium]